MKKEKILLATLIDLIILFIFMLFLPRFDFNNNVTFIGEEYKPKVKTYNIINDLSNKTIVKNNVNTNKIGKYNVECEVKYLFLNIKKNFVVEVKDNKSPTLTLKGNNTVGVCPNKEYVEEGYEAIDNYDGDITDKVKIENKDNIISYSVFDSSNNNTKIERTIIYEDKENPVITLNGNSTVSIFAGNNYNEPGYNASDNCDGDITSKVIVTSNINTNTVGTYKIKYEVTDSSNNTFSIERTVIVKKKVASYGNGKIYLTFDDGASHLTSKILDILDEENVKATFFVVGVNDTTKRAYNSGHAIGLHSNTHNYGYIYSSSDNYFNDLNEISNKVYNYIGIRPKIIRFPGGSSNTVSRSYQRGIMSYLTNEVMNRGYIYFDWNVDSNDAGSDIRNSQRIYYNVVNNLSHNKTNIVLMHDSAGHDATVNVLRDIIKFGKEHGYTFEAISENTPVAHHPINN